MKIDSPFPISWQQYLDKELKENYIKNLFSFLKEEKLKNKKIYPSEELIFSAFNLTPFEKVKVVILGQDPYHGAHQAHGLAFSVPFGIKIPPSLQNIYKELSNDLGHPKANHGNLEHWAKEGVLLLNTVLTVEDGKAGSHHHRGWENFTDKVISILNEKKNNLVFILWGNPAQKKGPMIDKEKHLIIKAPHPSPLSAHRGFLGSKPFSQTNGYLQSQNIKPIKWMIPNNPH